MNAHGLTKEQLAAMVAQLSRKVTQLRAEKAAMEVERDEAQLMASAAHPAVSAEAVAMDVGAGAAADAVAPPDSMAVPLAAAPVRVVVARAGEAVDDAVAGTAAVMSTFAAGFAAYSKDATARLAECGIVDVNSVARSLAVGRTVGRVVESMVPSTGESDASEKDAAWETVKAHEYASRELPADTARKIRGAAAAVAMPVAGGSSEAAVEGDDAAGAATSDVRGAASGTKAPGLDALVGMAAFGRVVRKTCVLHVEHLTRGVSA